MRHIDFGKEAKENTEHNINTIVYLVLSAKLKVWFASMILVSQYPYRSGLTGHITDSIKSGLTGRITDRGWWHHSLQGCIRNRLTGRIRCRSWSDYQYFRCTKVISSCRDTRWSHATQHGKWSLWFNKMQTLVASQLAMQHGKWAHWSNKKHWWHHSLQGSWSSKCSAVSMDDHNIWVKN